MRDWDATLLELGKLQMGPEYPGPTGAFANTVDVPVNALLLRRDDEAVLIDTGSGVADAWWPGAAGLPEALKRVDCDPAMITRIVLTHLDFDHAGGVCVGPFPDELEPAFPVARVAVLAEGLDWWRARDPRAAFNLGTRLIAELSARRRLDTFDDGAEVSAGVRVFSAAGHRPGHACVVVDGRLLHLADLVHHSEQIAHPDWDPQFDHDATLARGTRRRWLEIAAQTGIEVVHTHVSGAGRIAADGDGFRWRPRSAAEPLEGRVAISRP